MESGCLKSYSGAYASILSVVWSATDDGLARRLVSVGAPRVADVNVGGSVCVVRR